MEFAQRRQSAHKPGLRKLSERCESPKMIFKHDSPGEGLTSTRSSTSKQQLFAPDSPSQESQQLNYLVQRLRAENRSSEIKHHIALTECEDMTTRRNELLKEKVTMRKQNERLAAQVR